MVFDCPRIGQRKIKFTPGCGRRQMGLLGFMVIRGFERGIYVRDSIGLWSSQVAAPVIVSDLARQSIDKESQARFMGSAKVSSEIKFSAFCLSTGMEK